MKFKKYHRKYPENKWHYKAISTMINKKEIIYYTLIDKGKKSEGVEIFQGLNYIVGSSARSYSRRYNLNKLPIIYKDIVAKLKKKHKATKWVTAKWVNLN